jgi:hypothetical protein
MAYIISFSSSMDLDEWFPFGHYFSYHSSGNLAVTDIFLFVVSSQQKQNLGPPSAINSAGSTVGVKPASHV